MLRIIIDECKRTMEPFVDDEFVGSDTALYRDPMNVPEYGKDKVIEWRRPDYLADEPALIVDGAKPGDVKQGALGDCWFLGSVGVLATYENLLNNLILYDYMNEYGFCVFQFFKNGEWKPIIVDTLLPCDPKTRKLMYASSPSMNEFWLPLLEKAYAKLHGCYEVYIIYIYIYIGTRWR